MKKIFAFFMCSVLALSILAGCGNNSSSSKSSEERRAQEYRDRANKWMQENW